MFKVMKVEQLQNLRVIMPLLNLAQFFLKMIPGALLPFSAV